MGRLGDDDGALRPKPKLKALLKACKAGLLAQVGMNVYRKEMTIYTDNPGNISIVFFSWTICQVNALNGP